MGVVVQLLLKVWGYGFLEGAFFFFLLACCRSTQWEGNEVEGLYITTSFFASSSLLLLL